MHRQRWRQHFRNGTSNIELVCLPVSSDMVEAPIKSVKAGMKRRCQKTWTTIITSDISTEGMSPSIFFSWNHCPSSRRKNMATWQTSSCKIHLFKIVLIPVCGTLAKRYNKMTQIRRSNVWRGSYIPFGTNIGIVAHAYHDFTLG